MPRRINRTRLGRRPPFRFTSLMVITATLAVLSVATPARSGASSHRERASLTTAVRLEQPAGLASAPNGDLFIADQARNQVVVRLASGRLQVIAGTGKAGFSGDGALATSAELKQPDAVALAKDGTIYVADVGNNRVRALLPNGRIDTIAGDGRADRSTFKVGTLAKDVAMPPSDVAMGPEGHLYVASGNDVLELSASGEILDVINLSSTPGITLRYAQCDPQVVAVDSTGDLFIGCANSRELIERLADGQFKAIETTYRPHDFPGMAITKAGALLFVNGEALLGEVGGASTVLIGRHTMTGSVIFVPSGIAVSTNGTIYVDSQSGDGFTSGAALAKITPRGVVKLLRLWKEQ